MIQTVALILPAFVVYRLALPRIGAPAGVALAAAYLLSPAMQSAISWQFHPETIAAGFLSLAVLAAESKHRQRMALCLLLAVLCKEDVSFVVMGFGLFLWLRDEKRTGVIVAASAFAYFCLITFVAVPLINGHPSLYLEQNYDIHGGMLGVLPTMPSVIAHTISHTLSARGLLYLHAIFGPLCLLPLAHQCG